VGIARRDGVVTMMTGVELREAVAVLRDEVLDTVQHGDHDPPGTEVFEIVLRALAAARRDSRPGSEPGFDLAIDDAVSRRLAWGHDEAAILADTERVFDRLVVATERAFRDPHDQMSVIEVAAAVASAVSRSVALAAIARAERARATRLREEMTQRQLKDVLERQTATIDRLEAELSREH
jgi:hypothetical protein